MAKSKLVYFPKLELCVISAIEKKIYFAFGGTVQDCREN